MMFIQYLPLVVVIFIAYIAFLKGSAQKSGVMVEIEQPKRRTQRSQETAPGGWLAGGDILLLVVFVAGALFFIFIW